MGMEASGQRFALEHDATNKDLSSEQDGSQWTKVCTGTIDCENWEKSVTDLRGNNIIIEKPGYLNTIETTKNNYNNKKNQIRKIEITGQASMIYEYDEMGVQIKSGLDVDNNNHIDNDLEDRINEEDWQYVYIDVTWWHESKKIVYAKKYEAYSSTTNTVRKQESYY